jgi:predicted alpha/beta superfamily hydrolase
MFGRIGRALALAFVLPSAAQAADDGKLFPNVATIPLTKEIRFTSKLNGEPFTIQIWEQRGFAGKTPKEGFSVLYLLDGELYFPFTQFFSNAMPGDSPIIVGIGHDALNDKAVIARYAKLPHNSKITVDDANNAFSNLRLLDFTTPVSPENRGPKWLGGGGNYTGGDVDTFLRVIETEIKPRVEAIVPINKNDQAIFGHSLAGFAVLRALFREPKAFHTFIASSPTIWWNRREVLKDEAAFISAVRSGVIAPRVLITAAADEDEVTISPDYVKSFPPDKAAELGAYVEKIREWGGMKAQAKALGERLAAIPGKGPYKAKYELIPGVNHGTEPRISIWDALNFAFPR